MVNVFAKQEHMQQMRVVNFAILNVVHAHRLEYVIHVEIQMQ